MLIVKFWHPPNSPLIILTFLLFPIIIAIEDITNRKVLFGVPTKIETDEIVPSNELFLFHEDGRVELIQDANENSTNGIETQANSDEAHIFRAKPLPALSVEKGNERKPIDNFGDVYQRFNESIFNQAKPISRDYDNPYPPLPTVDFNDDPTPITEIPLTKSTINRAQVLDHEDQETGFLNAEDFNSGYRPTTEDHNIRRTTTQEPSPIRTTNYSSGKGSTTTSFVYTQHTPSEGRFQHFREQELLNENRHLTTTENPSRDNGSGNDLSGEKDETIPPPPAPDWAVNMMFAPENNNLETASEEPFLVTDSLKSAFSTPNGGQILEETIITTTRRPQTPVATLKTTDKMQSEIPTMKMYAWEMQRGDIDVRGVNSDNLSTKSTAQNTFTPLSKRRPQPESDSNSVLMPQELPDDVDLPMTYEIGPRLILPQDRDEGSGSGTIPLVEIPVDLPQRPPIAPPTLVSAERDRDELKRVVEDELQRLPQPTSEVSLHTAPRRGGSGSLLVPINTPKTAPPTLATFGQNERPSRLPSAINSGTKSTTRPRPVSLATAPISFTRPVDTSLPSFKINSEDYSNEVEGPEEQLFRTLATKPPGDVNTLVALPPSPDFHPGYTSQPGYEPNNGPPGIVIVSSPPGYFPETLVATTPSYLPKTSTPYFTETLVPKRPSVRVNSDLNQEYSPRVPTTTQQPRRTTTVSSQNYQDTGNSEEYVNQRVSYGNFGRTPPTSVVAYDPNVKVANQAAASFFTSVKSLAKDRSVKVPDAKLKVYDAPGAITNQAVRGGKAAYFFIPAPIRLSMSKAIQLRPFHGLHPLIHTPRHLLQNAVPTIPPSSPFLSPATSPQFAHRTTPSRLAKFRNDQTRVTDSLEMRNSQLNWVPIGLAAPKRLGAVKLVPAHSKEERIEIQPVEDLDAKRSDQICIVNPSDEFLDLRLEVRQIARKCFKRAVNCLLHEIVPLERRIGYTEEQCLNFCGHHPYCRSFSYSSTMSMCDIFDAHNGTGPAQTFSYAGSKYYEPLDTGSIALECWKAKLSDKFFTKAPQSSVLVDSDDNDELAHADQEQNDESRRTMNTTPRSAPVVVAPKDKCDIDKDVVVLKSVGFRLRNFGVPALYQNSSETECVFSCLVNLARGHVPYNCASTSYGRHNGCLIYRNGMNTHGNGHLVPEEGFTHYEKACVSNELVDLCRGYPIIRQPQHTLLGYSKQALQAQSLIECLELCFSDYSQGGNCKSVAYYYEERKDNCILNSESKQSVPQFFINEADELVDYASFESCFNARTDLRHKETKDQSQKYALRKPPRPTDRRFIPHAIAPPVGSIFKETTSVYTSTLITRPPPQIYGSLFMPKEQAEKPNAINTNQKPIYIVDTDREPKQKEQGSKRRNSKVPVRKFLITSEEQPKMYNGENDSIQKLSRL